MHLSPTSLHRITRFTLTAVLATATTVAFAQRPGDRRDDRRDDHRPPQQMQHNDNRPDFHFRDNDRDRFQSHYRSDAMRWRNNPRRPRFTRGQAIPRNYVVRPVPSSYYRGAPPPPPGYRYGYYDGYVVAYNPATRIIADVLDLITGN